MLIAKSGRRGCSELITKADLKFVPARLDAEVLVPAEVVADFRIIGIAIFGAGEEVIGEGVFYAGADRPRLDRAGAGVDRLSVETAGAAPACQLAACCAEQHRVFIGIAETTAQRARPAEIQLSLGRLDLVGNHHLEVLVARAGEIVEFAFDADDEIVLELVVGADKAAAQPVVDPDMVLNDAKGVRVCVRPVIPGQGADIDAGPVEGRGRRRGGRLKRWRRDDICPERRHGRGHHQCNKTERSVHCFRPRD